MASSLIVSWSLLLGSFVALVCAVIYAINSGRLMKKRILELERSINVTLTPEVTSENELNLEN